MKYMKSPLTFEKQADLLISRGLDADKKLLIDRLREVNYYRLSAYWYNYRIPNDSNDRLIPGTSFETVWERYTFDRQLRILLMDAVERIEVSIRTKLVTSYTLRYGPFGYTNPCNLPRMPRSDHKVFLERMRDQAKRSRESFVGHFQAKYHSEKDLPLWMAVELMTFNTLLTFYRNIETNIKQEIATPYKVSDTVLESWLLSINEVRNICAHHARLWNRILGDTPMIPRKRKHPIWHIPVETPPDGMFAILTILWYLMNYIAPQSKWPERFRTLIAHYPTIPLSQMGFPVDWQNHAIWNNDNENDKIGNTL